MEKERDNQPLDDLFARKLGKMSMPPSADGFERLQARMAQQTGMPVKVVFWNNQTVQRYMAVAACLLIVCLFGWLYWPTGSVSKGPSVAIHQAIPNQKASKSPNRNAISEQVATVTPKTDSKQGSLALPKAHRGVSSDLKPATMVSTNRAMPIVAQEKPVKSGSALSESIAIASANPATTGQLSENTAKPTPQAERVLVVVIEEPAVLVAARQERNKTDDQPVVATVDKPSKEVKSGSLWQKMKQLKQGELVAKSDNSLDDDQGLLSRAYTGLKHSIEKGKTTKQ